MTGAWERERLAQQQAELMQTLARGGTLPGWDERMLHLTARSLVRKRARSAARVWPRLKAALGDGFEGLFIEYASTHPLPADAAPLSDGRAFVDWLKQRQTLPRAAQLEVMAVDLRWRRTKEGLTRRRGPALKIAWLGRLVIALRIPGLGEWWWRG